MKLNIDLSKNRQAWIASLGLHLLIVIFFALNFSADSVATATQKQQLVKSQQPPVQAVTINAEQVKKQVEKLEQQHLAKVRQQKQREAEFKRMERAAQNAQRKKQRELKALAKLKREAEQAKRLKAERQRKARQLAKKLESLQAKKNQEAKRLAKLKQQQIAAQKQRQRQQQIAKQKQLDAKALSTIDRYRGLILQAIGQHWLIPSNINKKLSSELRVRLAPGGTVLQVKLLRSSGDKALDQSAIQAVYKASPLPVPSQNQLFNRFRVFNLTVRPEGLLNGQ